MKNGVSAILSEVIKEVGDMKFYKNTEQVRNVWNVNNGDDLKIISLHAFFICNTFIINASVKLVKNQANIKQRPEAELSKLYTFTSNEGKFILQKVS